MCQDPALDAEVDNLLAELASVEEAAATYEAQKSGMQQEFAEVCANLIIASDRERERLVLEIGMRW